MTDSLLTKPLRGIIPPLLTPLAARDQLDVAGLERLVEHVLAGGVHGLFILGTTGEGPSLSYGMRHELVERVCRQVARRVPVLVGITDTSFAESVRLAEHAEDAGAQAVVASAPYYFPIGQAELRGYIRDLVGEVPLPVFLYNMPSHTKVVFELDTLRAALELPNVIGLKDSGGNLIYFHQARQLVAARPDWSLLIGPEELLGEAVLMGAHGGVCGGANLAPRLYVDVYEAACHQDVARVRALHERIWAISRSLYGFGVHRGLKCALSCLGICNDLPAEPFPRLSEAERRTIAERLATLGPTADKPVSAN
ncbi:dihydrodipicolinate synthase family protein [Planctomycetaceae bacterium SCGC AG-212-F19]|nr:dihydrodipicolinate synthase family protein [Planctomycetaceae bacterium SCGC AG-212-F19]